MAGLKAAGIEINRKMLADLAVREEAAFGELASRARGALENGAPEDGAAAKSEPSLSSP